MSSGSLDFYKEGQQLAQDGDFKEACDAFMIGIFSGRKVVEQMQNDPTDQESIGALEWLGASFVSCGEARIQLGDVIGRPLEVMLGQRAFLLITWT